VVGNVPRLHRRPLVTPPRIRQRTTWPEEMGKARDIGVIADLQCGGWSTSILTDKGVIYSVGVLNGMNQTISETELAPLLFHAINTERPKAHTAIRQFSSGRRHILGLSDDGTIWSWADLRRPACSVAFTDIDGPVQSVVAGWDKSSALIKGCGIVLWDIIRASPDVTERSLDEWVIIPKTGYRRPRGKARNVQDNDALGETVGEVMGHILLEHFVIFVTDLKKVFACRLVHDAASGVIHDIFELSDISTNVKDVQGSFRNFAVLKSEGEVLIANEDYLDACARQTFNSGGGTLQAVTKIPALQSTGVVQIAFGDYHYHALHSDGSISSYGVEPGGSGALGLGGAMDMDLPHGMLRGIKQNPWNRDGVLLPHAYTKGRRIWFQRENEAWIRFLAAGGKNKDEAQERMRQVGSMPPVQAEVSEWVEQMGSGWDKRPKVREVDEDGLGAYFALSVAAAGWHSGALVLVNDNIVNAVRESCLMDDHPDSKPESDIGEQSEAGDFSLVEGIMSYISSMVKSLLGLYINVGSDQHADDHEEEEVEQHVDTTSPTKGKRWIWADQDFPRLQLDHGVEMPGEVDFMDWKEHKPDWKMRWTGDDRRVFGVPGWAVEE
jgi:SCF-associated factor 1